MKRLGKNIIAGLSLVALIGLDAGAIYYINTNSTSTENSASASEHRGPGGNGEMGTPPELPSGEAPADMGTPPDAEASTDSSSTDSSRPTPPDMTNSSSKSDKSDDSDSDSTDLLLTSATVATGFLSAFAAAVLMWLIVSSGNKFTAKDAFDGSRFSIFVVGALIIALAATAANIALIAFL